MREVTPLLEDKAHADPLEQFRVWFEEALWADLVEPTAMALATADSSGQPSVRMVLLKSYDSDGFLFYTNYASRKGEALAQNPRASLLLWWDKLYRQIRVEGSVEKLTATESETYFHSRPRGSQISALASPQSHVIPGRQGLEEQVQKLAAEHGDREVPLPPDWGGYRLKPDQFEFWQGRPDRLHDRLRYLRDKSGKWKLDRLAP